MFHNKKYHFAYIAYTVFVLSFLLLFLIIQVKSHNLTLAFLACCGLTFFILWRFFRPVSDVKKEYKSDKIQKQTKFTFKFYHKLFTIEDDKQISTIKYYQLYRVFETRDFFYLYIDKSHSFLIDKSCFKKNSPDNFSKFIKKKCWWNYKFIKTHKN